MGATYFQTSLKTRSARRCLLFPWDSYSTRNSISREVAEVPKHKRGRQRHPRRLVTPHPRKGLREVGRVRPSLSSPVCRLVPQGSQWFRVMVIPSRRDYHPSTNLEQRPVLDYILVPNSTYKDNMSYWDKTYAAHGFRPLLSCSLGSFWYPSQELF